VTNAPLMPKATAVWLVENTALSFDQIAYFCNLHPLEVKAIADGDAAQGIKGMDPLIADVSLFDLYHGEHIPEDKKSLAYSIRYQAHDRTLREEEVNLLHEKVLLAIKDAVGGVLRG